MDIRFLCPNGLYASVLMDRWFCMSSLAFGFYVLQYLWLLWAADGLVFVMLRLTLSPETTEFCVCFSLGYLTSPLVDQRRTVVLSLNVGCLCGCALARACNVPLL